MSKLFEKTDYEIELFHEEASSMSLYYWSDEDHIIKDDSYEIEKKWLDNRLKVVHATFKKEYNTLVKKRKYFYGCPFEIYKETFNDRLVSYLTNHKDFTLITFIESELNEGIFLFNRIYMCSEMLHKIQTSLRMRYEFLVKRVREENYNVILLENDKCIIESVNISNSFKPEDLIMDNSSGFSVKERIIALYKLGVLDYLYNHPDIDTVNKVAKAVKTFTGFNQGTIQSYINPIFKQDTDPSKSALINIKQVNEVQKHLDNHVLSKKNKT